MIYFFLNTVTITVINLGLMTEYEYKSTEISDLPRTQTEQRMRRRRSQTGGQFRRL